MWYAATTIEFPRRCDAESCQVREIWLYEMANLTRPVQRRRMCIPAFSAKGLFHYCTGVGHRMIYSVFSQEQKVKSLDFISSGVKSRKVMLKH